PYGMLRRRLLNPDARLPQCNLDTDDRRELLDKLEKAIPANTLLASIKERKPRATGHDLTLVPIANVLDNNSSGNNNDQQQPGQPATSPPENPARQSARAPNERDKIASTGSQAKSEVTPTPARDDPVVALKTLTNSGSNWFQSDPYKP